MMASDSSEESDYEDARQHHDNEEVDNLIDNNDNDIRLEGVEVEVIPVEEQNFMAEEAEVVEDNFAVPFVDNQDDLAAGINARMIVQHVIDNLWPIIGNNNGVELVQNGHGDGLDNLQDGYFVEENRNFLDSDDDDDTVSFHSETDEQELNHGRSRQNESGENNLRENAEAEIPAPVFDQQIPGRHDYLGEAMEELPGRAIVLEAGATPEIPLLVMGLQLVPGQTLPLTIFHNVFQNAIRRCVSNDRLFGIVHNEMGSMTGPGSMLFKGAFGTLAEIYEFQEESDPNADPTNNMVNMITFALKAKGRQRFNVLDFRRQADGNLMGRVQIRPEIRLYPLPHGIQFENTHRYRFQVKRKIDEVEPESHNFQSTQIKQARTLYNSRVTSEVEDSLLVNTDHDLVDMRKKIREKRKVTQFYSAFTPFPYFVYEQFEELVLVERVHRKLKVELRGLTESGGIIPKDASELSFWLAQNLTMDDHHRIKILKMDSPIYRLRYELNLLSRASKVITCQSCNTKIADSSEIFSMSVEGPQGTYVNPQGFVHETLTVHKTKDVKLRGFPSTLASWFPGYAWTIAECRRCSTHLGWKFKAVGRLTPKKFWGLARKSISFKYDFASESDQQDPLNNPTPPTSASDGSLTV